MKEATDKQLNYIEDLIKNMSTEERQDILKQIHAGLTVKEASEIIDNLKNVKKR